MNTTSNTSTTEDRLQALEFVFGQTLLLVEAASTAQDARLQRLEDMLAAIAPPMEPEDEDTPPFTLDGLGSWLQTCLKHMRKHQSVTASLQVAIGEAADRILSLGQELAPEQLPAAGPDVHAALQKAKRPPPAA